MKIHPLVINAAQARRRKSSFSFTVSILADENIQCGSKKTHGTRLLTLFNPLFIAPYLSLMESATILVHKKCKGSSDCEGWSLRVPKSCWQQCFRSTKQFRCSNVTDREQCEFEAWLWLSLSISLKSEFWVSNGKLKITNKYKSKIQLMDSAWK